MFGMGGSEILVILIVALLFLGPDKLPDAAKTISKGIRDIKRQSRALQRTIEDDEHIGGAIRDLRSALRGEDDPVRPQPIKPPKQLEALPTPDPDPAESAASAFAPGLLAAHAPADAPADAELPSAGSNPDALEGGHMAAPPAAPGGEHAEAPRLTLPPTAGERDDAPASGASAEADLAALVKPAPNTIARGTAVAAAPAAASDEPESKHG